MNTSAPSSYLVQILKHAFQCGSLDDVSDYVATSTAKTKERSKACRQPQHKDVVDDSILLRKYQSSSNGREKRHKDPDIPGLESSNSSGSSIYVVPSREAMEEFVRDSKRTRRQGLFDMDRMFAGACGSREHTLDDVEDECEYDQMVDENDSTNGATGSDTAASVFSRSAGRKKVSKTNPPIRRSVPAACCGGPLSQVQDDEVKDAYHVKIHLSPPPQYKSYIDMHDDTMELRRTFSDTMSQLPEVKTSSSSCTTSSGLHADTGLSSTTAAFTNE